MSLTVHLRQLDSHPVRLHGQAGESDLALEGVDELIRPEGPVEYDLTVERHDRAILVRGSLRLMLRCECARCLKGFQHPIFLRNWSCLIPLEGEDKVLIVNDSVDLTPLVREDILLAFPQHPLCESQCRGVVNPPQSDSNKPNAGSQTEGISSAWAELDKLKL